MKAIVDQCISKDAEARPRAAQLLSHFWFQDNDADGKELCEMIPLAEMPEETPEEEIAAAAKQERSIFVTPKATDLSGIPEEGEGERGDTRASQRRPSMPAPAEAAPAEAAAEEPAEGATTAPCDNSVAAEGAGLPTPPLEVPPEVPVASPPTPHAPFIDAAAAASAAAMAEAPGAPAGAASTAAAGPVSTTAAPAVAAVAAAAAAPTVAAAPAAPATAPAGGAAAPAALAVAAPMAPAVAPAPQVQALVQQGAGPGVAVAPTPCVAAWPPSGAEEPPARGATEGAQQPPADTAVGADMVTSMSAPVLASGSEASAHVQAPAAAPAAVAWGSEAAPAAGQVAVAVHAAWGSEASALGPAAHGATAEASGVSLGGGLWDVVRTERQVEFCRFRTGSVGRTWVGLKLAEFGPHWRMLVEVAPHFGTLGPNSADFDWVRVHFGPNRLGLALQAFARPLFPNAN